MIMANDNIIQPMADDSQIVLYQPNESVKLEVKVDAGHETVWLTQQQIADLFGTKRPAITKHLGNIFKSGELDQNSVSSILEHTASDGNFSRGNPIKSRINNIPHSSDDKCRAILQ